MTRDEDGVYLRSRRQVAGFPTRSPLHLHSPLPQLCRYHFLSTCVSLLHPKLNDTVDIFRVQVRIWLRRHPTGSLGKDLPRRPPLPLFW